MLQMVEVVLGKLPTAGLTPEEILGCITEYGRAKRNVKMDRITFCECHQSATETFDEFYIRLRNLTGLVVLCPNYIDEQLDTSIMTDIRDTPMKQKLLAMTKFPSTQTTMNLCHSEETTRADVNALDGQLEIIAVHGRRQAQQERSERGRCYACSRVGHHKDYKACPAIDQSCNGCGVIGHFFPCCSAKQNGKPMQRDAVHPCPQRPSPDHIGSYSDLALPVVRQGRRCHPGRRPGGVSRRPRRTQGTRVARARLNPAQVRPRQGQQKVTPSVRRWPSSILDRSRSHREWR